MRLHGTGTLLPTRIPRGADYLMKVTNGGAKSLIPSRIVHYTPTHQGVNGVHTVSPYEDAYLLSRRFRYASSLTTKGSFDLSQTSTSRSHPAARVG